jgi:hypothetical protein
MEDRPPLWTTVAMLFHARDAMVARGFAYKSIFT